MESALTPREIQSRVRAGASLEEVARQAGVSPEAIAPFADPVLAERDHVAGIALSSPVRRQGEPTSHRILGDAIEQRFHAAGLDLDIIEWDTWRMPNRRWVLRAVWPREADATDTDTDADADATESDAGTTETDATRPAATDAADPDSTDTDAADVDSGATDTGAGEDTDTLTVAEFHFDLMARFSVAATPWARWLIGDGPNPDDHEDSDQLAIVRALGDEGDDPATADASEDDAAPGPADAGPAATGPTGADAPVPAPGESTATIPGDADQPPRSTATPQEIGEEVEADMDQALSLAPGGSSDLDVLYDMLGGIAEDSVNIYAELDAPHTVVTTRSTLHDEVDDSTSLADEATERLADELRQLRQRPSASTRAPEPDATDPVPADADDATGASDPVRRPRTRAERRRAESEQPSLVEQEDGAAPKPRRRKRRAQVPSWDEIMFGSPPRHED